MIYIAHRGMGGQYSNYAKEAVKRISRRRDAQISQHLPSRKSYIIAIDPSGAPADADTMKRALSHDQITFVIGDSNGLEKDVVERADEVISLNHLEVSHQITVCVLLDNLERFLML